MNQEKDEVMLDLLCAKAMYGLTEQEEKQLADLQREAGLTDESLSLELTAATIGLAGLDVYEEMPVSLRSKIMGDAEKHFKRVTDEPPVDRSNFTLNQSPATGTWFDWLGWAVAAAACLALAFNIYYTRPQSEIVKGPEVTPSPQEQLGPAQMRQRLIESAPDLARGSWGAGNVKELTPSGDIVWSDARQAGYMRLTGLPVNDPGKETYQLWIFDETQDDKTPIDGGTFNVNAQGEIIVPINAKLNPRNTKMYAITVEKPGGVVVSKREKIVALAKREA